MCALKRTKDLTPEEINAFDDNELQHWMNRIMARLHGLVDKKTYSRLARDFVVASGGGNEFIKKCLIQFVELIKSRWPKEDPPLRLVVTQPNLVR